MDIKKLELELNRNLRDSISSYTEALKIGTAKIMLATIIQNVKIQKKLIDELQKRFGR